MINGASGLRVSEFRTAKLADLAKYFVAGMDTVPSAVYIALLGPQVRPLVFPIDEAALLQRVADRIDEIQDILLDLAAQTVPSISIAGTNLTIPTALASGGYPIKQVADAVAALQAAATAAGSDMAILSAFSNQFYNYPLYLASDKA